MKYIFSQSLKKKEKGLSLLEIILVISIIIFLSAYSVSSLFAYRDRQLLNTETSQVLSILNKARSETLASKSQLAYGVRLNADRIILYPTVFASSTSANEEHIFRFPVIISSISLNGGGLDILFERLTGETTSYGTFQITLPSGHTTISVSQTGFVGLQN